MRCYTGSSCKSEQQEQESGRRKHAQRQTRGKFSAAADGNQFWVTASSSGERRSSRRPLNTWMTWWSSFTAQEQHLVSNRQNYKSCWSSFQCNRLWWHLSARFWWLWRILQFCPVTVDDTLGHKYRETERQWWDSSGGPVVLSTFSSVAEVHINP